MDPSAARRRPSSGNEHALETLTSSMPLEAAARQQTTAATKTEPTSTADEGGANSGTVLQDETTRVEYIRGWRLWVLTAALWISLFLSTLETTIVSTSLVSITNALNGFILRDWLVTAYLLTYTGAHPSLKDIFDPRLSGVGFLTIYAKFSDVFGRKTMLLLALAIFTIFSALCGASDNIIQLIIFRAFQGLGASGIYAMVMVIAPSLVPPAKYGKYMAIVSTVFIVASVLGPVLGGVINTRSSWRWVFLLNIPGGVVSFVLIAIGLPASEASSKLTMVQVLRSKMQRSMWARINVLGMTLLLASSVLLVFALEEGGTRFPWDSGAVVSTLVLAIVLGIAFAVCRQEAVFPPSICKDRLLAAMLLTAFFIGFPFVSIVVNIPQRAQAVYALSPVDAGLALLPLLLTSPVATALSGLLTGNAKVPPFYLIIVASIFQVVGVGLTCSLPTDTTSLPIAQYGFEVLMGIGFGLGLTTLLTFARVVVPETNLAVMMGAITQVRVLGGTISLAICATILNNHLAPKLDQIVTPEEAAAIFESLSAIKNLTSTQQDAVRKVFAEGYNQQNIFMTALTALALVTSCFLWEKTPRKAV
ncbi:putative MFS-type transporter YusP [Tolypocladium ophioglossoides CBS 100239]|uniref:Putative MFS-type transporter YusP n=1 Tax=Tolypocladium ophioglossoides (strain CBS 100239) TaxID=1163406 RepID=A0A0L0N0N7_TOLOC|nr:putative MFS-type transporter YusP [Tolypocladium ophioglossoides CBS 100239]